MPVIYKCDICETEVLAEYNNGKFLKPHGWIYFSESVLLVPYIFCVVCKYSKSNSIENENN